MRKSWEGSTGKKQQFRATESGKQMNGMWQKPQRQNKNPVINLIINLNLRWIANKKKNKKNKPHFPHF